MIKRIENEYFIADINEVGAELYSLKSKTTGIEYLWQGDSKYWAGRSPVLFPICGRLYKGKYVYRDKEYLMDIHGIAKSARFTTQVVSESEIESVVFTYFNRGAVLRVKNTTESNIEFIYEIKKKKLDKTSTKEKTITESLYAIGGIEYVNIVTQNDEISG